MTERSNFTNIFSFYSKRPDLSSYLNDPVSDNFKLITMIDLDLQQIQPNKKILLSRKLSSNKYNSLSKTSVSTTSLGYASTAINSQNY